MVQPLVKPKIVKKHTKKFKRHQHDRKIAVKVCLIWFGTRYILI